VSPGEWKEQRAAKLEEIKAQQLFCFGHGQELLDGYLLSALKSFDVSQVINVLMYVLSLMNVKMEFSEDGAGKVQISAPILTTSHCLKKLRDEMSKVYSKNTIVFSASTTLFVDCDLSADAAVFRGTNLLLLSLETIEVLKPTGGNKTKHTVDVSGD